MSPMPIVPTTVHELPMLDRHDAHIAARGHVEVVRAEKLEAVIHHRDQRATHRPCADQRADREQDEDCADSGADARDRRLARAIRGCARGASR